MAHEMGAKKKQLYANDRQWAENKRASQKSSKIFAENKKLSTVLRVSVVHYLAVRYFSSGISK